MEADRSPGQGNEQQVEELLVLAARAGDKTAFANLVRRHADLLLALCRRALRDDDLAQEAAQEAIVQALLNLDRLRDPSRFGPWLAGIGINAARRLQRERMQTVRSWEALQEGGWAREPIEVGPTPDERAEMLEAARRVRRAVGELAPAQRSAIILFYLAGLTYRELAALLGIEVNAVKARLNRGRVALRSRLGDLWKEERVMGVEDGSGLVDMRVADMRRAPSAGDLPDRFAMLLDEIEGKRRLCIWVGPAEGTAIALMLQKTELPRPIQPQFAARLLEASGARLVETVISKLAQDTFYAEAVIEGSGGRQVVDCRPSDAIALALLAQAPIRVEEGILRAVTDQQDVLSDYPDGAAEIVASAKEEQRRALELLRRERRRSTGA
jgi:RNA polymerase sigma factor (sigma-70 family)